MEWGEVLLTVCVWLGMAAVGGAACAALWFLGPRQGGLLPPYRERFVPWGGLETIVLFILVFLFWPGEMLAVLNELAGPPAQADEALRENLAAALALPFQVATIFLFLWRVRRVRPFQLGIHGSRFRANVVLGYLTWLVLCPAVYAVSFVAEWWYTQWAGQAPEPHTLIQMIRGEAPYLEWSLLWFLAVVVAPVVEELFFRGVLLGWLTFRPWGGDLGMVLAISISMVPLTEASPEKMLFVLAVLPGYILLPAILRRVRQWQRVVAGAAVALPLARPEHDGPPATPEEGGPTPIAERLQQLLKFLGRDQEEARWRPAWAIYAAATLFALAHKWPDCVPLFLLGLGLGWLAWRTRSLIGPMVVHALFNSVACLAEWLALNLS
jgi:membrane protease YdiL (CAAX protease family)